MSEYGMVERKVGAFFTKLPWLKSSVKRCYQGINYLFNKKNYFFKSNFPLKKINRIEEESFFGYYDNSPENIKSEFVVFHAPTSSTQQKPSHCEVNIVLYDRKLNTYQKVDSSRAYNWQQGSKLQWLTAEKFIFNVYDEEIAEYKAKIYNTELSKIETIIDIPIYDCFLDIFALSLNFGRLNSLRPDYGYRVGKAAIDISETLNDGIFYVDLMNNTNRLIIPIQKIIEKDYKPTMEGAEHKFNHIMISPDGKRFMFLHRWYESGKRYDRLYIADSDGENIKLLLDDDMVSHCCWNGNDQIIGYFNHFSYGPTYYKIDLKEDKVHLLSEKLLGFNDGHPSVKNGIMVFDSYPDRSRMKKLHLYDIEKDELYEEGEFFESLKYHGETRCDLHPRWNFSGSRIYIDSVHEGKRQLYAIEYKN